LAFVCRLSGFVQPSAEVGLANTLSFFANRLAAPLKITQIRSRNIAALAELHVLSQMKNNTGIKIITEIP